LSQFRNYLNIYSAAENITENNQTNKSLAVTISLKYFISGRKLRQYAIRI